ncbi:MAG: ABC transporter permease [Oscillospiraceae bacterium]|nr:ABC transporter permease [Oscillospiraceae bacterium]
MLKLYTIEDILKEYARQDELIRSRQQPEQAVPQETEEQPEQTVPEPPEIIPEEEAPPEPTEVPALEVPEKKRRSKLMQLTDRYGYLMEQLIKRDFKARYKGTFFGVLWSLMSPFAVMLVQYLVFSRLFGRDTSYVIYLLTGTTFFNFFNDSTMQEMFTLRQNAGIISKINVPKLTFFLSKAIACLINFAFVEVIYFAVLLVSDVRITPYCIGLVFPATLMFIMNMGIGYILSGLSLFFKDTQYIYTIFTNVLLYLSATFYYVSSFPAAVQKLFYLNPVYCFITYARTLVIEARLPSFDLHLMCMFYALLSVTLAYFFNKKYSKRFIYYI